MSDLDIALPTQSDIDRDRHRELKTSATKPVLIMSSDYWFPMSAYVRQFRQCYIRAEHGRKCGDNRWNRFAMCFRSKVISTSGFHFRFRVRHLSFGCRPPRHARAISEYRCGWYNVMYMRRYTRYIPVQNSDIPSPWNCTHVSAYPRSDRIPFPVTSYEILTSLCCSLCGTGCSRNMFYPT